MSASTETKQVFRWLWPWGDEALERWLGEMSLRGWHLGAPGCLFYTFHAGEPAQWTYRTDYRILAREDREEYLGLFRDAGWEFVGEAGGWYIFRTSASGRATPEIFSDRASRIAKYTRIMAFFAFFLLIMVVTSLPLSVRPSPGRHGWITTVYEVGFFLRFGVSLALGYVIVRLGLHIRALKKRP
jgi:hypothetical protein